jgi:prepilin-type N-terminal cleavage/methylation domain-containing protein
MITLTKLKSAGFTLLEVIITLVVAAIVGAMLVSILDTSMTKNLAPIFHLQKSFALHQVMENIITHNPDTSDLTSLRASIGAEGSTQNNYGQNNSGTNTEYVIVDNHFIKFDESRMEVNNIDDNDPDYGNYLKVTIQNSNNETLTKIFVKDIS